MEIENDYRVGLKAGKKEQTRENLKIILAIMKSTPASLLREKDLEKFAQAQILLRDIKL